MAKKPPNSDPIFDDVALTLTTGGLFNFSLVATDPDPKNKLKYYFEVDGKPEKKYTAPDGTVFKIEPKTGEIFSKKPIDFFPGRSFDLPILVEDNHKGQDTGTVHLSYEYPVVNYSLDIGDPFDSEPAPVDASTAAFHFTDSIDGDTHVSISGFSEDDVIEVSGIASMKDLSFTTGNGPDGVDDLVITYNSFPGGVNITILEDVLVNPGFVFDYETAVAAVGYDFLEIDPSLIVLSIDIDGPTPFEPHLSVDANTGTFRFTDDVDRSTYVSIVGFSSDDLIAVHGIASVGEYSFARGWAWESTFDDLSITYNNFEAGVLTIITLENVLHTPDGVYDYASAVASMGFDFMVLG